MDKDRITPVFCYAYFKNEDDGLVKAVLKHHIATSEGDRIDMKCFEFKFILNKGELVQEKFVKILYELLKTDTFVRICLEGKTLDFYHLDDKIFLGDLSKECSDLMAEYNIIVHKKEQETN